MLIFSVQDLQWAIANISVIILQIMISNKCKLQTMHKLCELQKTQPHLLFKNRQSRIDFHPYIGAWHFLFTVQINTMLHGSMLHLAQESQVKTQIQARSLVLHNSCLGQRYDMHWVRQETKCNDVIQ